MYIAEFDESWEEHFNQLDDVMKERVTKKIGKILEFPEKRHLRKLDYFVDEVGPYRIIYRIFKSKNIVYFYLVLDHKAYEKWYKQNTIWILF
ncbi:MAG: type II toxin-antitoxin system RelE/ParE family toxin [Candidatus Iainarchaeum archaeon]|uniref:Type II toxin-antitoxin system RelE/ParE family toxin n=1 Tax=Candidatus Iainarchaeum sp. TaxID=3101447 RepID=A0A7T9DJ21_9ARCH|nr:MAG: type II toxin-antitoxin system RelE/ParE family toxin [Candidatus Diapherotrites archaeon]